MTDESVRDVLDVLEAYANGHSDFMGDQAHFPDADEALLAIHERLESALAREQAPERRAWEAACVEWGAQSLKWDINLNGTERHRLMLEAQEICERMDQAYRAMLAVEGGTNAER